MPSPANRAVPDPRPPSLELGLRRAAVIGGAGVVLLGLSVLVGWALDVSVLQRVLSELPPMKANSAALFVLLGSALSLGRSDPHQRTVKRLGGFVAAFAALTLAQDVLGFDLGIDRLLIEDPTDLRAPGRMAPTTAVGFVLLGAALVLRQRPALRALAQLAALAAAAVAFVSFCGHLYGAKSLLAIGPFGSIALHTTLGLMVSAGAFLAARPDEAFMVVVTSRSPAGAALRRLLPVLVVTPVSLGWIRLRGQDAGLFGTQFGVAILVSSCVILLVTVTWFTTNKLQREEILRFAAEGQLTVQLRIAIDAAPIAMLMVDGTGRIILANAAVHRLFGYDRADLLGAPIESLVPALTRGAHVQRREAFFAQPEARQMGDGGNLHGVRKDGREVPVEIGLNPVVTSAGTLVLATIVDVRERLQVQLQRQAHLAELHTLNEELESRVEARTAELSAALVERGVLLQEVHHRVKNNLQVISSLINMQVRKLDDPGSRAALRDCQSRVLAIALIHEQLYQSKDYARVPFSEYAVSLARNVFEAVQSTPGKVSLRLEVAPVALPVDKAIPCGLILNELITNALKHAFPENRTGSLTVTMRRSGSTFLLAVADDGVGLGAQVDLATSRSLGMQLVATLVQQIDGDLAVVRAAGATTGTTFRVTCDLGARE